MNAHTPIYSRAITEQVLERNLSADFMRDMRADAARIAADAKAGRVKLFHGGLHTDAEIAAAMPVPGGYVMPGTVGDAAYDAWRAERGL